MHFNHTHLNRAPFFLFGGFTKNLSTQQEAEEQRERKGSEGGRTIKLKQERNASLCRKTVAHPRPCRMRGKDAVLGQGDRGGRVDLNDQVEREAPGGATTTRESGGLRPRKCMDNGNHGCVPRTACKQGDLSEGTREQGDTLVERKEGKEQGTRRKTRGAHHQAEKRAHKDAHRVQHMLLHACGKMSHEGGGLWIDPREPSKRLLMQRKTREQGLLAHGQWLPCVRCVTCMRAGAAGETRWRTR